jgi:hypothetical protein
MQSLNADGRHFAELRVLSHDFYKKRKTMAIEGLDLTAKQRIMIDDAADRVFTSQLEPFYKYIDDILRAYREIRDSDVRHACHAALLRYGQRR